METTEALIAGNPGRGNRPGTGAGMPPREEPEFRTQIRLPVRLAGKLREIARRELRSMNSQVVVALERLVREYEREHGPVEPPPAD